MAAKHSHYNFIHCDVFAKRPYSGNSLAIFPHSDGLSSAQMLSMTRELRHFESIFLSEEEGKYKARIFDLIEELPFAGHPIIGAACSLHKQSGKQGHKDWHFVLAGGREVSVSTRSIEGRISGTLDQGRPDFVNTLTEAEKPMVAAAFNLKQIADLPLEVISTGLRYLIVPVVGSLQTARIAISNLEQMLNGFGADFAYLLDVSSLQGRHWNNDGIIEDVATGSAAGVVGAYALKHKLVEADTPFCLKQGHFIGRPSDLIVTPYGTSSHIDRVTVTGEVAFVGQGQLIAP